MTGTERTRDSRTTVERTHRWWFAFALVLFLSSTGLYFDEPHLVLASIVGVAYAGYPLLVPEPTVDLRLSRTLSEASPEHGERVTVTATVTNAGERTIADLRIVDGVPSLLAVTEGTPRHAATLPPGASTTFEYAVTARHGRHQFESATAVVHDVSGGVRVRTEVTAGTETTVGDELECSVDVADVQLRREARRDPGRTTAEESGAGLEFHHTRTYERGDPVNRVDWKRFARTGDVTTVEFHEDRRTAVVLCLDARASAIRARRPTEPHAVSYCVAAATEVLHQLRDRGERVGVAAFGSEFAWLAPGTGRQHCARAEALLAEHRHEGSATLDEEEGATLEEPDRATLDDEERATQDGKKRAAQNAEDPAMEVDDATTGASGQVQQVLARSAERTEAIVFSPLLDEFGTTAALRLEAGGCPATVVSPDVTTDETLGGALAGVERANRIDALRRSRVPVADWSPDERLVWPANAPGRADR